MNSVSAIRVHVRWMIERDMPEVLQIERSVFDHPWAEEDFIRMLRQRNTIGMVAEHAELVVGFMIYELHRRHYELLNLAVHRDYQRRSVGREMMRKMISKLSSGGGGRDYLQLKISERNLPAHLFFRTMGFRAVRVLRGYWENSAEDAYLMVRRRIEPAPFQGVNRMAGLC